MADIDRVTRAINVWASVHIHRLAGGFGTPEMSRCGVVPDAGNDPPYPEPETSERNVLIWDTSRSDKLYEASVQWKYNPTGVVGYRYDESVQLEFLIVERVVRRLGNPPVLIGLLLWIYPTAGDLCIKRPANWDPENPYRSYRPRKWIMTTVGAVTHKYMDRSIDRMLRNMEQGFRKEIAGELCGYTENDFKSSAVTVS